jgi:uncharacterized glyoxalase superfamily protein PhnB
MEEMRCLELGILRFQLAILNAPSIFMSLSLVLSSGAWSKMGAIFHFDVVDIDAVMSRASERGAETLYSKKEIAPGTWVAKFEDSEGFVK